MNLQVRRAEKEDIPEIKRLLREVGLVHHNIRPDLFKTGTKYTDHDLMEIINNPCRPVFVAVDIEKGNIAGYCMTEFQQIMDDNIRTDIKTLYIDDLCVDEAVRGRHTGQTLYEYVKKYAADNDFYNLTLHVWEGNDSASAFYRKMGLKPQYTCLECVLK